VTKKVFHPKYAIMPTHSENRHMPHSAQQMYDLIADVGKYHEFLPWCSASRIRKEWEKDGNKVVDADVVISFKVFRERFTSRVTMKPEDGSIDVEYIEGPFKYLHNFWKFIPNEDGTCTVDFHVDFEFKSAILQSLIGLVFNEAMRQIVGAFEKRAAALYGDTTSA
jgi:coenzyme Q-binding protein COQ10